VPVFPPEKGSLHVYFFEVPRAVQDAGAVDVSNAKGCKKRGRKFRLKCNEDSTFSVLIPAQKSFLHRGCFEDDMYSLLAWFSKVEPSAWECVNHHCINPPDKIFLVVEQTLTSRYAITHKTTTEECEIELSARGPLPEAGDAKDYLGYNVDVATATSGFEFGSTGNAKEYVIFLTVRESFPMRLLKLDRPSKVYARVQDIHR
jgi:hypothetical protein